MTPSAPPVEILRFLCPQCKSGLSVPGELAGIKGPCPHCGTEIIAPNPATNLPATRATPAAPEPQPFQSAPADTTVQAPPAAPPAFPSPPPVQAAPIASEPPSPAEASPISAPPAFSPPSHTPPSQAEPPTFQPPAAPPAPESNSAIPPAFAPPATEAPSTPSPQPLAPNPTQLPAFSAPVAPSEPASPTQHPGLAYGANLSNPIPPAHEAASAFGAPPTSSTSPEAPPVAASITPAFAPPASQATPNLPASGDADATTLPPAFCAHIHTPASAPDAASTPPAFGFPTPPTQSAGALTPLPPPPGPETETVTAASNPAPAFGAPTAAPSGAAPAEAAPAFNFPTPEAPVNPTGFNTTPPPAPETSPPLPTLGLVPPAFPPAGSTPQTSPPGFSLPGQPQNVMPLNTGGLLPPATTAPALPPFSGRTTDPQHAASPTKPRGKQGRKLSLSPKLLTIIVPAILLLVAVASLLLLPRALPDNLRGKLLFWQDHSTPTPEVVAAEISTDDNTSGPGENTAPNTTDGASGMSTATDVIAKDSSTTTRPDSSVDGPENAATAEPAEPPSETDQLLAKIRDPGNSAAGTLDKPMEALNAFLAAPDWNTRLQHALHPERVGALMKQYYSQHPDSPVNPTSIRYQHSETDEESGKAFYVFHVTTDESEAGFPVAIEDTDDGFKIDWEAFVEFKDNLFQQFAQNPKPGATGEFHVILRKTHFFDKPFPEITNLTPYRVDPPIPDQDQTAFVSGATLAGKSVASNVDWGKPFTPLVELTWRKSSSGADYLEITNVLYDNWRTVARFREQNPATPADGDGNAAASQETAASQ